MKLLPLFLLRLLAPCLAPLRWLTSHGWLRAADVDWWLQRLHPLFSLQRVYAQVTSRRWVAEDMLAINLRCNGNAKNWRAGQHVQLYWQHQGTRLSRSYSLTAVRGNGEIELAIKRQPGGKLSALLLDGLRVGARIELAQASGELVWPQQAEGVLLLAAGSGITALFGLLRTALANGYQAPVTLLHYVRQQGQQAFEYELRCLMQRYPNLQVRWQLTAAGAASGGSAGRFNPAQVDAVACDSLLACGPQGFIETARQWWQSAGRNGSMQYEAFSAPRVLDSAASTSVALHFARSRQQVTGNNRQNLLEQAETQGLRPAHGCRQGICASCTCTLLSGSVRDQRNGAVSSEPGQSIRLCVSVPLSAVVIDL